MITIILTTTVHVNKNKSFLFQTNKNERIDLYLKSIKQWLQTGFTIIVVENSGYTYELNDEKEKYKHRFEVINYNEDDLEEAQYLRFTNSKGASEMFAINYAYQQSKLIHSSTFIIKVTGRFFIPELEKYLNQYNLNDYECLTQSNRDRCEMVGAHYRNFLDIFSKYLMINGVFEPHVEYVWKDRTSKHLNLTCKEFHIEKTQRGGVNEEYLTI